MKIVDFLKNDKWTDEALLKRSEAIVRSFISAERETILNRKVQGQTLGQYTMTEDDIQELQFFQETVLKVKESLEQAFIDREIHNQILDSEKDFLRLKEPFIQPEENNQGVIINSDIIQMDLEEREKAHQIIDPLPQEVKDALELRYQKFHK